MERFEGPKESRENVLWGTLPPLRAFRAKRSLCPHTQQHWSSAFDDILTPTTLNIHMETVIFTLEVMFSPWWLKVLTHPSILSQQPADERRSTAWTSGQLIAGLRARERQTSIHT